MADYYGQQIDNAVKTIIAEAGGEGYDGMFAVANVIVNRANSPQFPNSIDGVVTQVNSNGTVQFDGFYNPGSAVSKMMSDAGLVQQATTALKRAMDGETADPTGGATFFSGNGAGAPSKGLAKSKTIGGHTFYTAAGASQLPSGIMPQATVQQASISQAPTPMAASLRPPTPAAPATPFRNAQGQEYVQSVAWNGKRDNLQTPVVNALQKAQAMLPFSISATSGFRSQEYNAKIGGAKSSQHLGGNAVDVSTRGLTDTQKSDLVRALVAAGFERIGTYGDQSLHADMAKGWSNDPSVGKYPVFAMYDRSQFNMKNAPSWFTSGLDSSMPGGMTEQQAMAKWAPTPAVRGGTIPSVPKNTATDPVGSMPSFSALQSAMSKSPAPIASDVVQSTHAMLSGPPSINTNVVQATHDALKAQGTSGLSPTAVNVYASNGLRMPSGYSTSVPSVPAPPPQMQMASIPAMPSKSIDTISTAPRSLKNVQADDIGSMPSFGELQSMMAPPPTQARLSVRVPAGPMSAPTPVPTAPKPVQIPTFRTGDYSYQPNEYGGFTNIDTGTVRDSKGNVIQSGAAQQAAMAALASTMGKTPIGGLLGMMGAIPSVPTAQRSVANANAYAGKPYSSKAQQIAQAGGFDANGGYIGGGIGFGGY